MTTRSRQITRRTALSLALSMPALASTSALAQFSIGIGGVSTDDFKNIGKMLGSLKLDEEDEIRIGNANYGAVIDQSGGAYRNRAVQADIDRFTAAFFSGTSRPAFAWEATVVDNNEINAWVLPGGKIGLNKGLLRYVANEHELAAVVAHEMGHAEMSHAIGEMKKASFADGLTGVAQKALVSELDGSAGALAGAAVASGPLKRLVTSGYSRKNELEADSHILTVFDRTGHDVRKGCAFYETLLEVIPRKAKGTTSLFAGHPDTQKRLDELMAAAADRPEIQTFAPLPGTDAFASVKQTFPTRAHYLRNQG